MPDPERPEDVVVDIDGRTIATAMAAAVGVVLLFAAGHATRAGLTYLVLGTLLALALSPMVGGAQRALHIRRGVAVALVVLGFVGAVALLGVLLGPPAVRQARDFSNELPQVVEQLGTLPIIGDDLQRADAPAKVQEWIERLPERLGSDASPLADAASSVLGGAIAAFATGLVAICLLLDGERVVRGVRRAVPVARRPMVDRMGVVAYRIVGRYFAGSLLVACIAGLGILIVGTILGVPLTPLAAIWVICTNLIPQIGGFLGGALFVLLGASKSGGTAVACLAWFLVYQQFENHVLGPTVVGEAVDLSPPVTMVAALVGASAGGVPGALVAVPLVGTVKAIYLVLRYEPEDGPDERRRLRLLGRLRSARHNRHPTPVGAGEGAPGGSANGTAGVGTPPEPLPEKKTLRRVGSSVASLLHDH